MSGCVVTFLCIIGLELKLTIFYIWIRYIRIHYFFRYPVFQKPVNETGKWMKLDNYVCHSKILKYLCCIYSIFLSNRIEVWNHDLRMQKRKAIEGFIKAALQNGCTIHIGSMQIDSAANWLYFTNTRIAITIHFWIFFA